MRAKQSNKLLCNNNSELGLCFSSGVRALALLANPASPSAPPWDRSLYLRSAAFSRRVHSRPYPDLLSLAHSCRNPFLFALSDPGTSSPALPSLLSPARIVDRTHMARLPALTWLLYATSSSPRWRSEPPRGFLKRRCELSSRCGLWGGCVRCGLGTYSLAAA
jgi:hypothetical protein